VRVLYAEDEPDLRSFVAQGLGEAGYAVDAFGDGTDAWIALLSVNYDLIVLDIKMPGLDGIEFCRRLHAQIAEPPPVLLLTARDAVDDRVLGLDSGADDYLVKPFAFAELLARLRSLLRKGRSRSPLLRVDDLEIDPAARVARRAGAEISLSAKEYAVLEYLMHNAGRAVTRQMICDHVWNFDLTAESNFVDVFIYALRKKIDIPHAQPLIRTVRGVGYKIEAPPDY
jgi:two-component system copper resistance phosphate regulon response regulator CusR